jgi:serine/threonine-protein kinase 24/25/MST4
MEASMSQTKRSKSKITNYELINYIGKGSFGQVYKGLLKKTGEIVAIKMIDLEGGGGENDTIQSIEKEIQCLVECQDPHVTKFYESFI